MITYYVVVPFCLDQDGMLCPDRPMQVSSAGLAKSKARDLAAKNAGAIAFSRSGDPTLGDFKPAEVIASYGEVDLAALEG